jgi:all-trans-retinol dehydrogenase (NAD+)
MVHESVHLYFIQMVRTFLDGMIDRKRGHIVGISSLAGKISIPLAACYTATKFGLRGFMSSLFDELCAYNHDDYIKTTTVYPSFINTRKQMTDVLDKTTLFIARMPASYVANKIVDGIVNNKRSVTLPPGCDLLRLMK